MARLLKFACAGALLLCPALAAPARPRDPARTRNAFINDGRQLFVKFSYLFRF